MLAALAVTQVMHAYPDPGTQVTWGLWVAAFCGVVTIADGVTELATASVDQVVVRRTTTALACAALVAVPLVIPHGLGDVEYPGRQFVDWIRQYRDDVHVGFPGTGPLRATALADAIDRPVVNTLRRNCDTFIALPDAPQFYVEANLRPLTGFNTVEFENRLTRSEQRAVLRAVGTSDQRVCLLLGQAFRATASNGHLVMREYLPLYLLPGPMPVYRSTPDTPLLDGLYALNWQQLPSAGGYQIWRRSGR
jgi:hypothetical protein